MSGTITSLTYSPLLSRIKRPCTLPSSRTVRKAKYVGFSVDLINHKWRSNSFAVTSVVTEANVVRKLHKLPSGKSLEVLEVPSTSDTGKRPEPLVFIHGSYHAAWCWTENFIPYFSSLGHDCYAISLLAQGGSDVPDDTVAGTIQSHAQDIAHFIANNLTSPPVLIGHSFGGLIVQSYLADVDDFWRGLEGNDGCSPPHPRLTAGILACSVPPSGNAGLVLRYLKTKPIASIKVTLSLAGKLFEKWTWLCRETFFSPEMSDAQVQRYQLQLQGSSKLPLFDLRKLNASLPVAKPPPGAPPILVLGAENDFVVDLPGLLETAEFYGVEAAIVLDIAHDIMLDVRWRSAAKRIESWLASIR